MSTAFLVPMYPALAKPLPSCPANSQSAPYPAFAKLGDAPAVAIWRELSALPAECHIALDGEATLTVALASTFNYSGSIEQISERLGAVSKTQGLRYWSVGDNNWRKLVSEAFAVKEIGVQSPRADFSSAEILSGQQQVFVQNDTRSWGRNLFSMRAISSSPNHLIFESKNSSAVSFGPITLFKPGAVKSVLFIHRLEGTTWQYFNLSLILDSAFPVSEKSLLNRQAAFYRFLREQPADLEPPLAR